MNEPVAFVTGVNKFDPVMVDTVLKVGTPIYTHQVKELTDEEIIEELKPLPQLISMEDKDFIDFAREILRKAQEK